MQAPPTVKSEPSVASITQLNPPIPVNTPKGKGLAHLVVDYGPEYNLLWTVFIDATGECWTFANPKIRARSNISMERDLDAQRPGLNGLNGHALDHES